MRKLVEVAYEITHRCNLHCAHCYQGLPKEEMGWEQIEDALSQMHEMGVEKLKIGGGEPLLHPHLFDVTDRALELGMECVFSTNGILVEDSLEAMLAHRVGKVQVSLDNVGERHDSFRGRQGLFEIVDRALSLLYDAGISVNVATTLTTQNHRDLGRVRTYVEKKGVKRWKVLKYIPKGAGDPLMLAPEDYRIAVTALLGSLKQPNENPEIIVAREFDLVHEDPDYNDMQCFGGKSFASLKPNGDVSPCSYLDFVCGNLTERPLREIWEGALMVMFSRDHGDPSCVWRKRCNGGCKAVAHYVTREWGCDPYCWAKSSEYRAKKWMECRGGTFIKMGK